MQLEFHQLDRCWEHLRVRHAARQRRLLASLAETGQQTPIVVVAAEGQAERYVVIDGYQRIAALEQLGRDTVVLLDRSLRMTEHETALEVGWLLAELEQRFGYGLDELARRFDRSVSWVSRRLASATYGMPTMWTGVQSCASRRATKSIAARIRIRIGTLPPMTAMGYAA
jgi:ParB family chromosome partitioning protein